MFEAASIFATPSHPPVFGCQAAAAAAAVSPTKRPRSAPLGGKAAKVESPAVSVLVQQRIPVAAVGQLRASQQVRGERDDLLIVYTSADLAHPSRRSPRCLG
jgi:hypothetical protein